MTERTEQSAGAQVGSPDQPVWTESDRREQFRLTRLSLLNWGTFAGLHEVPIAPDGFLIVGRSGSGKSTLLDAYTALLVPPRWTSFNAAAREGDRSRTDRNLVNGEDLDVPTFLRRGVKIKVKA